MCYINLHLTSSSSSIYLQKQAASETTVHRAGRRHLVEEGGISTLRGDLGVGTSSSHSATCHQITVVF